MKGSSYLSLRERYIEKTKRRIGRLDSEIVFLTEVSRKEGPDLESYLCELIGNMRDGKHRIEETLDALEDSPKRLWRWTMVIDELEQVWARINRWTDQAREALDEPDNVLHSIPEKPSYRLKRKERYYVTQY